MLVVRFMVQCLPERADQAEGVFQEVVRASRGLPGVIHFDVARDVLDANAFVATEVFADREALERQESLPEVGRAMAFFETALASAPEATVYEVASSAPWG